MKDHCRNQDMEGEHMEVKSNDYCVAQIAAEEVDRIKALEQTLSEKFNRDIVLIAYQPNDATMI